MVLSCLNIPDNLALEIIISMEMDLAYSALPFNGHGLNAGLLLIFGFPIQISILSNGLVLGTRRSGSLPQRYIHSAVRVHRGSY